MSFPSSHPPPRKRQRFQLVSGRKGAIIGRFLLFPPLKQGGNTVSRFFPSIRNNETSQFCQRVPQSVPMKPCAGRRTLSIQWMYNVFLHRYREIELKFMPEEYTGPLKFVSSCGNSSALPSFNKIENLIQPLAE